MFKRVRAWLVVAALFTLINVAGVVWAAALGEPRHAAVHVGLTIVGAYLVWRLAKPARPAEAPGRQVADERLEMLQQSVDAVAIEVERIGEAQRFSDKLQSERSEPRG